MKPTGYFGYFIVLMVVWLAAITYNDFLKIQYGYINGMFAYTTEETVELGIAFAILLVSMPILLAIGYMGISLENGKSIKKVGFMKWGGIGVFIGAVIILFIDGYFMFNVMYAIATLIFAVSTMWIIHKYSFTVTAFENDEQKVAKAN